MLSHVQIELVRQTSFLLDYVPCCANKSGECPKDNPYKADVHHNEGLFRKLHTFRERIVEATPEDVLKRKTLFNRSLQFQVASYVFAYDVEFQIYTSANLEIVKVGVFKRVRNDSHLKRILL